MLEERRLPRKFNATVFEKFTEKLEKRINLAVTANNTEEDPKKKSTKDLSNSFDVQYSMREKMLKRVL
jgi:CRISPR/Cas system-associated endonuclease Cas3-HD